MTSIREHEYNMMLCCEISHKVLRTDSVMDQLKEILKRGRDFQTEAKKELIGTIVMTPHNNCTYRIDDIDFNESPNSTFLVRNNKA